MFHLEIMTINTSHSSNLSLYQTLRPESAKLPVCSRGSGSNLTSRLFPPAFKDLSHTTSYVRTYLDVPSARHLFNPLTDCTRPPPDSLSYLYRSHNSQALHRVSSLSLAHKASRIRGHFKYPATSAYLRAARARGRGHRRRYRR